MKYGIRPMMLILLVIGYFSVVSAWEKSLTAMRSTFLQAEEYIKQDRDTDYFALADTLKSYPLYPYLQYQWLVKHLDDHHAVQTFLLDHASTRYAGLLHRRWMAQLGERQEWRTFIKHYKPGTDDDLECYFARAQYFSGQQQAALATAQRLWISGTNQPAACDALFDLLKADSAFSADLVWDRFQTALALNNVDLAKSVLPLFKNTDADIANLWLKVQQHPQAIKQAAFLQKAGPKAGVLLPYAITRWLEDDPQSALATWNTLKKHVKVTDDLIADTEKKLGMALAFRRDEKAYQRLSIYAGDDVSAQEWRIRAALSQQNWPDVLTAIAALSPEQRNQDKWQYWQARALAASQQTQQADIIFQAIAPDRSFYGFLAAEHINTDINLSHKHLLADNDSIETLQNTPDFVAIKELLTIDRRPEATRQWWYAIAEFDTRQLAIAAKLAQRWQWPSMAIFTAAKGNLWDDMELRFPLHHDTLVSTYADHNQLDPAIVFALIRQESAFDSFAGSSAGAIGLMQVMPKTARQIAADLKEDWRNDYNLLSPEINIKYGSHYFKQVLDQFNGHVVLATAAYNAGPARVKQWLPQKQALPADIWIETIPYKETRNYVSSVLMYSLIYQKRMHRNRLNLSDLLQEIPAG